MDDASHQSPADSLERRARRLNFWVVWGFAVFDVLLALFQPIRSPYSAPLLFAFGIALDRVIAALSQGRAEPWTVSIWVATHLAAMLGVLSLYRLIGYRVVRGDIRGADGAS